MSWSRSYSGTADEVLDAARAERESIEASLPEFERADVRYVIYTAEDLLDALPLNAKVTLTLSGHGWRDTTGAGGGGLNVGVGYSVPAPTTL